MTSGSAEVRILLVGVGAMTPVIVPLLLDRGYSIVGAVARSPEKQGRDVGEVVGLDSLGVRVVDDLAAAISMGRPTVAVVAAASMLQTMAATYRTLLSAGIDVVSLEEQSTYPWRVEPDLAAEIDELARANGASLISTGAQDVFWINLVATLAGAAHRIDTLRGYACWDAGEYGVEPATSVHVGDTREQFEEALAQTGWTDFIVRPVLEALVGRIGLTPVDIAEQTTPLFAEVDLACPALNLMVPAGHVIGVSHAVTAFTEGGTEVTFEMAGKLYAPGEVDANDWVLRGAPGELRMSTPSVPTRFVTATAVVSRIPDAIEASPGLLSLDGLPATRYRPPRRRNETFLR